MRRHRTSRVVVPVLLAAAGLAGCGSSSSAEDGTPPQRSVTVFAAASLTEAFTEIARTFEDDEPGTTVVLSFGASSALAQQVLDGAPADVFAAANPATMQTVVDAGAAEEPEVFARGTLQIAVPADGPDVSLQDFGDPALTLALCAPEVPCGAAARDLLADAGVTPRPDTLEQDVKAALSKVRLGEVDAALVYRTDVLSAGDEVRGIDVPRAAAFANDYLVAPLTDSREPSVADLFVQRVLSQRGQQVLADAGFDRP